MTKRKLINQILVFKRTLKVMLEDRDTYGLKNDKLYDYFKSEYVLKEIIADSDVLSYNDLKHISKPEIIKIYDYFDGLIFIYFTLTALSSYTEENNLKIIKCED